MKRVQYMTLNCHRTIWDANWAYLRHLAESGPTSMLLASLKKSNESESLDAIDSGRQVT